MLAFIKENLGSFITLFVTLLGFVVNYLVLRKSFKDEIHKFQVQKNIDKLQDNIYDIIQLLDDIQAKSLSEKQMVKNFQKVMASIYAYGSKEAISIMAYIQSSAYKRAQGDPEHANPIESLTVYPLLISQVKYDMSGEIISPEYWFQMKINDFEENRDDFKAINNLVVDKLKLNPEFKFK